MLLRMSIIKIQEITSIGKDVKERETLFSVDENINWYSHYEKHVEV